MANKIDAEMLKKHHFWVLQLLFGIPLLVAIFCVLGVSDATEQLIAKSKAEKAKIDGTKAQSQFKRDKLEEQKVKLFAQLDKMWSSAWDSQKEIYVWPQGLQPKHREALAELKFGTPIEPLATEGKFPDFPTLREQFHEEYLKEYQSLPEQIAPMYFRGRLEDVLKYQRKFRFKPTSEDLFLAMEDLWVETIMVDTIESVNRRYAQFEMVGPPTAINRLKRTFRSPLWEVEIRVEESEDRKERWMEGTIKNLTNRLLGLGDGNQMVLAVWLDAERRLPPFPFVVEGEQIPALQTVALKKIPANKLRPGLRVDELARVEQVFDIKTVPVKRIDRLEMGYKSNRQQVLALKMAPFSEKAIADAAAPADGSTAEPAPQAPPGRGMPMGDGPGGPGAGGTAASDALSPCGLIRRRYIDVTPQVRRMPIAVALICEQSYMQDVLIALANTKLRFQITQDHFRRCRDLTVVNPPVDPNATPANPGIPPVPPGGPGGPGAPGGRGGMGAPAGMGVPSPSGSGPGAGSAAPPPQGLASSGGNPPRPGMGSGSDRPGRSALPSFSAEGPGGFPGRAPPPAGFGGAGLETTNNPAPDQTSNNLVELSVYGVASLYEKYVPSGVAPAPGAEQPAPPVPAKEPAPAAAPAAPTAPAPAKENPPAGVATPSPDKK